MKFSSRQNRRMVVAERIIHTIRKKEQPSMEVAAERLYVDYMTEENLTVFTQLDSEDFGKSSLSMDAINATLRLVINFLIFSRFIIFW
ncbi:MAG: hypothetical protein FWH18_01835 [Marinilabiliaceae bacterium]|nr:hypothetical protein [Marinilabiliaceae bacterium]